MLKTVDYNCIDMAETVDVKLDNLSVISHKAVHLTLYVCDLGVYC